jgi:DNA (cytosine-5)-methyltransferase 1
MNFTFADLFAGIGGFHAALEHHGGRSVFISEIDSSARSIYSQNWLNGDEKKIDGDITMLTEGSVRVPKHDVLTGGFPCQPFSKSGNQHGVAEARGTLFYNILRVIEAKKPELILLENVRNLVGPNHINDYRTMIRLIRDLGYVVSDEPTILSPHEIPESLGGTPQHRERVFIGAVRLNKQRANHYRKIAPLLERHPFSQHGPIKWDLANFLEKHSKTLPSELPGLAISPDQDRALRIWNKFVKLNQRENGKPLPGLPLWTEYWKPRSEMRLSASLPDWKKRFIERNSEFYMDNQKWIDPWRDESNLEDLIPSYRKFEWQAQANKDLQECLIQFRPSGIRVKAPSYVPTFVAMAQTPVIGWEKRSLSVDEAKALQGFPRNFEFGEQRASISFKQIGNAVHVGVASIVFQALVKRAKELDQNWANELTIKNSQMKQIPSTPPLPNK